MVKSNNIVVNNAKIVFRNFIGKREKYNDEGRRNFCVVFDPEMGTTLQEDGWNIKWFKPKDDGEEPNAYLQVSVNYDSIRPPKIFLKTSNGTTLLDEISVSLLDTAEIENLDLIINPSKWQDDNGKWRVKAYLRSMEATIYEDEIELRNSRERSIDNESYEN